MFEIEIEPGETSSLVRTRGALIAWSLMMAIVIAVFGWLSKEVIVNGETAGFDVMVHNVIHTLASPFLTTVMKVVTFLASLRPIIVLWLALVGFLVAKGHKCAAAVCAITAVGEGLLSEGLKKWIDRPRPCPPYFCVPQPDPFSFPSGHAMASFCFCGVLAGILAQWLHSRRAKLAAWTGAALMTALVGCSRVYLGCHYPTDVLGGYLIGFIWLVAVWRAYHIWIRRAVHEPNASNRPTAAPLWPGH
jgi:undecaprenyl-diphosphatase